jgi:hypothetical protein
LAEGQSKNGAHQHSSLSHITDIARFFTKPLQGNLSRRFIAAVLVGHAHVDTLRKTMSADCPAQGYGTGKSASFSTKAIYADVEKRPSQQEFSQT